MQVMAGLLKLGRHPADSPPRIGTCIGSTTPNAHTPLWATVHPLRRCSCPLSPPGRLRHPDRLRRPGSRWCSAQPWT